MGFNGQGAREEIWQEEASPGSASDRPEQSWVGVREPPATAPGRVPDGGIRPSHWGERLGNDALTWLMLPHHSGRRSSKQGRCQIVAGPGRATATRVASMSCGQP